MGNPRLVEFSPGKGMLIIWAVFLIRFGLYPDSKFGYVDQDPGRSIWSPERKKQVPTSFEELSGGLESLNLEPQFCIWCIFWIRSTFFGTGLALGLGNINNINLFCFLKRCDALVGVNFDLGKNFITFLPWNGCGSKTDLGAVTVRFG